MTEKLFTGSLSIKPSKKNHNKNNVFAHLIMKFHFGKGVQQIIEMVILRLTAAEEIRCVFDDNSKLIFVKSS